MTLRCGTVFRPCHPPDRRPPEAGGDLRSAGVVGSGDPATTGARVAQLRGPFLRYRLVTRATSHSRTVPSSPAVQNDCGSAHHTSRILPFIPFTTGCSLPDATSHRCSDPSLPPASSQRPSGENRPSSTQPL